MAYPVRILVGEPERRDRLSVAFRIVLALPHAILVGPLIWFYRSGSLGLLGAAAYFLTFVNWCTVLFTGRMVAGVRDFVLYYLR